MKSEIKKCNTMLKRNIEEIQSHLEEIVHLKEKEIKLTRLKQLELEQYEADQRKNHQLRLRLSKRIRYYAKSGKLKFLKAVLNKAKVHLDELVNWKSKKGCTALHWAASRGHLPVIEELISNGANPTIMTDYGQLPADLTRHKNLRLLLLDEAQKWNDTRVDFECEEIPPSPKQPSAKIMRKAVYSEMSDYIHSLKKLKDSKINRLIDQYSTMQSIQA